MVRRRNLVGMTPLGSHVACLLGGAVLLALQGRHSLAAQVQSRPVPLEPTFFHDTLLSKVPTAGSVRAGILAGASGDRTDPTQLTAFLPANASGTLCVNIISQDGRYEAIAQYRLGGVPVGARRLRLRTSYQSQLARYAPRQLAVLARIAPRCDESAPTTLFVVTSWTGEIAPGVLLLINSRANTRIDEVTSAGLKTIATCEDIQDGVTVAYNKTCQLPARPTTVLDLRIRRKAAQQWLEQIPLRLSYP